MASPVYFTDMRASLDQSIPDKIAALLAAAGLGETIQPAKNIAVKIHFGERGNTAFVRPVLVRRIVQEIKALGGMPYLTDTCTLYRGSRETAPAHIVTAIENGFAYSVVGAPIVIADGIRGTTGRKVRVDLPRKKSVSIGQAILDADALVVVSHFKGHELSGFGGALKNLGMGCATREGKLDQHSGISPVVKADKCVLCGACHRTCGFKAITLGEDAASIDETKCVGCGECIVVCPEEAISVRWIAQAVETMEKMVEYAYGATNGKPAIYINFLTQISPACDCYGHADAPIVPDIGIAASLDPVALDAACADLVNRAPGMSGSKLSSAHAPGADKFRDVYPSIDWTVQLAHAEQIGMGSRAYELIDLPKIEPANAH